MGQGMVLVVVVVTAMFVAIVVGAYFLVRILANKFNTQRDSWAMEADELKLNVERSANPFDKKMAGTRDGRKVSVEFYKMPTDDEGSFDEYAAVEVQITKPLAFSFEISKPEMLSQRAAMFFGNDNETGHEFFDKAFHVTCSDIDSLTAVLNVEMLDGENSTFLTDLMSARKKYHRVGITDQLVRLGVRATIGDSQAVEATIKKAIYLSERFEAAYDRYAKV